MTGPCDPVVRRRPNLNGKTGSRAWLITHPPETPDQTATVRAYLVHAPQGNPLWPWYMIACVHLRPIADAPPAFRRFAEASHEILFAAIDPETYPSADPDQWLGGVGYLEPLDLVHQVANLTDEQAAGVLNAIVRAIVAGESPDQDFRSHWQRVIEDTADHFRAGIHC